MQVIDLRSSAVLNIAIGSDFPMRFLHCRRKPPLDGLRKLVQECWNPNDEKRPDFGQVLPMILKLCVDCPFDMVDKESEQDTSRKHIMSSENWSEIEDARVGFNLGRRFLQGATKVI